jgi:hypothetical protein
MIFRLNIGRVCSIILLGDQHHVDRKYSYRFGAGQSSPEEALADAAVRIQEMANAALASDAVY